MRQPTPLAEQYAWWRHALDGCGKIVASALEPQCGWYKRKMVSGGIHVPAKIWIDQRIDPETGELIADEVLRCEVDGREEPPLFAWPWLFANPITESEFHYMRAMAEWAREHAPDDPAARPRERLDPMQTPIRF